MPLAISRRREQILPQACEFSHLQPANCALSLALRPSKYVILQLLFFRKYNEGMQIYPHVCVCGLLFASFWGRKHSGQHTVHFLQFRSSNIADNNLKCI